MTILSPEQFRLNWRESIDVAYKGGEVVIERYNKPVAVLVNYDEWQQFKQIRTAQRAQTVSLNSDNDLTAQELEALRKAQIVAARGGPTISHEERKRLLLEWLAHATN